MMKVELSKDAHEGILTFRKLDSKLSGRNINANTYQFNYNFKSDNDFVDLKFISAYNKSKQKYLDNAVFGGTRGTLKEGETLSATNEAITLNLSNSFEFSFDDFSYEPTIGINFLNNKNKNSLQIQRAGSESFPFSPKGELRTINYYVDNIFDYKIFEIGANFSFNNWHLKGHKDESYVGWWSFPRAATDINKKDTNFNYSFLGTVNLLDLFMPFISYSKTTRAPNVQEMFFSSAQGNGVNPFLKPEIAKTWQFGVNGFKQGLIKDDDVFGFKVLRYITDIDDYIYNRSIFLEYKDSSGSTQSVSTALHLNQEEVTKFRGWEAEMSYDMDYFFAKVMYSKQTNNQILNELSGVGAGKFGSSAITKLPESYGQIELGTRFLLLNESWTLGMITKITGEGGERVRPDSAEDPNGKSNPKYNPYQKHGYIKEKLPKIPTIYDLYTIYKPTKNFTLRFEVQNLFDKKYLDVLNAYNSTENQYQVDSSGNDMFLFTNSARGRTFLASFEYKY